MDNKILDSEKKAMDKGWRAMRATLDSEMPTKKRRRLFFWLWLGALGLLLSAVAVFLYDGNTDQPYKSKTDPKPPVAVAPKPTAPAATSTSPVAQSSPEKTSSETSDRANRTNAVTTSTTATAAQNRTPKNGLSAIERPNDPIVETKQPEPTTQTTTLGQPRQPLASIANTTTEQTKANHSSPISPKATPNTDLQTIQLLHPVATPGLNPLNSQHLPELSPIPFDVPIEPVAKKRSRNLALGLTAGILTNTALGYTGFTAGGVLDWDSGKRWGLRGGIQYQHQTLQDNERTLLRLTSASYSEATGEPLFLDTSNQVPNPSTDLDGSVFVPISRLHRIEFPIAAYWNPFAAFRLYGGLTPGTMLFAQSGNKSLQDNTNKVLAIDAGQANRNLNREISNQVRDWSLRGTVGLGYRFSQHFSAELFLHYPFRNATAEDMQLDTGSTDNDPGNFSELILHRTVGSQPSSVEGGMLIQAGASFYF